MDLGGRVLLRLSVQAPLYLAGAIEALGVARVIMGWPLFLAGAYFTYRVLAPVYRERRAAHEAGGSGTDPGTDPDTDSA